MSEDPNTCPICGDGQLTQIEEKEAYKYRGQDRLLKLIYSVCNECGSEQANSQQLHTNKMAMLAFKKEINELLTGIKGGNKCAKKY